MSLRASTSNTGLPEPLTDIPQSSKVSSPQTTISSFSSSPTTVKADLSLPPRSSLKQFDNKRSLGTLSPEGLLAAQGTYVDGNDDDATESDDGYVPPQAESEANETCRFYSVEGSLPLNSPTRDLTDAQSHDLSSPPGNPLPLPPAITQSIFNANNPGLQQHKEWAPLSAHTAKCDNCNKNNKKVIQRCKSCNRQLCRTCIATNTDGIHVASVDDLNWTPAPQPTRPRSKRRITKKRKATTSPLLSSSSSKVAKTTVTPGRNTRNSERARALAVELGLPLDRELSQTLFVDKSLSADKGNEFDHGSDTEEDLVPLTQEFVRKEHEQYKIQSESTYGKNKGPDLAVHPSSSLQNETAANSGYGTSMFRTRSMPPLTRRSVDSSAGMDSSIPHSVSSPRFTTPDGRTHDYIPGGSSNESLSHPVSEQATGQYSLLGIPADLVETFRGNSFSEALTEIKKVYDIQQTRKEEQAAMEAKERAYHSEKIAAWESDPTITAMRNSGKMDEALEMLDAAAVLVRMKRGLM